MADRPGGAIGALGNIDFMRRDYLPADYARDTEGQGITASIAIEAVWDPDRSPVEETRWLAGLDRPPGIACKFIAAAPLVAPDLAAILDGHADARRASLGCARPSAGIPTRPSAGPGKASSTSLLGEAAWPN